MKTLPIELYKKKFVKALGFGGMSFAIWLFFADVKDRVSNRLKQHEMIHYYQQLEMLFIFHWIWYGVEFIVRFIQYRKYRNLKAVNKKFFWQIWHKAYQNISLEREAYANGGVNRYLKTRKRYAWIKYLKGQ